jgi:hypothetical protein
MILSLSATLIWFRIGINFVCVCVISPQGMHELFKSFDGKCLTRFGRKLLCAPPWMLSFVIF